MRHKLFPGARLFSMKVLLFSLSFGYLLGTPLLAAYINTGTYNMSYETFTGDFTNMGDTARLNVYFRLPK